MPVFDLMPSFQHAENGMTRLDMIACQQVANTLDEVIIFRSTGPWSRRWLEDGFPSKNFHVKGKSSDWGPQAGFVPYDGTYSKVGHDQGKAQKGTRANQKGINDGFASARVLELTLEQLTRQLVEAEELPARTAVQFMEAIPGTRDFSLLAQRSGDGQLFEFRACWHRAGATAGTAVYRIHVYTIATDFSPRGMASRLLLPLEVMCSSEAGANDRPMTGDYDLMAVCPRWSDYGSTSMREISKPGLVMNGMAPRRGQVFAAGTNLDKVMTMETTTGRPRPQGWQAPAGFGNEEHYDMGNITPRILRCINLLNGRMVNGNGAFRRVHHNAESHRHVAFGALVQADMENNNDGFPLTVFQPDAAGLRHPPIAAYRNAATLLTMREFRVYAGLLQDAGYFLPRNAAWGMSIRDAVQPA
ncbi:CyaA/EF/ExoY family adenylyl cyclase toxin [Rugamonas sp. A1-17]|nr:CyaA/EF/ExoY family adenylyl cyclase toxin [Rugamonas sp. A1-17]